VSKEKNRNGSLSTLHFLRASGSGSGCSFLDTGYVENPLECPALHRDGTGRVGGSLIALARYQLGKPFAVRAEAHELFTHGLYSKIRNPIYVFGGVMFTGVILVVQKPVLWVALVAMVIGQVIRARREAHVLEDAFGDAYREYRRKTWF
jgi:hypothetical protein